MIKWLPVLWVSSITRIGRYIFHQRNVHWLWQWLCWLNPLQWLQVKQKTHRLNSTFAGLWSHVRNNLYPCMSQDVFGQCTKSPTRFAYIQTVRWFSNSFRPLFSWDYTDILITFLHIYITIPLKANTVVKNVTAFANRPDPLPQCESVVNALKMLDLNSIWGASKSFERKHAPHLLLRFCIQYCMGRHRIYTQWLTSNRHSCKEAVDQRIISSDCQSQNRRFKKLLSMSLTTELDDKHGNRMICLSAVYWSSWGNNFQSKVGQCLAGSSGGWTRLVRNY